MLTPHTHPNRFRIVREYLPDGAANSNFSYRFTDNNLRDLISLNWLMTRDAVAATPTVGLLIWAGPGLLTYRHWSDDLFDSTSVVNFDAFQGTSYTGRITHYGSIVFPLPTPCYIFPYDYILLQSDFAPAHCTFTEITAIFKLWPME